MFKELPVRCLGFAAFFAMATFLALPATAAGASKNYREISRTLSAAANKQCGQYDADLDGRRVGADKKFSGSLSIELLLEGPFDWYRADVFVGSMRDSVFYNTESKSIVCGKKNWDAVGGTGNMQFVAIKDITHEGVATAQRGSPVDTRPILGSQRPIALMWEGYSRLISGTINLEQGARGGAMRAILPNNDGVCDGTYTFTSRSTGTWGVECTNQLSAKGTFEAYGANKGSSGVGRDLLGRSVTYTIGGN